MMGRNQVVRVFRVAPINLINHFDQTVTATPLGVGAVTLQEKYNLIIKEIDRLIEHRF
jgi:hypothetical protein